MTAPRRPKLNGKSAATAKTADKSRPAALKFRFDYFRREIGT